MTKVKSPHKFWLFALPVLAGLGMALLVPSMARAQRLLVSEAQDASLAGAGRQSLGVGSGAAPSSVTFTLDLASSSVLTGVLRGSAAWGDYDNDGDLDILLSGFDGSNYISSIYENIGSGFEEDLAASSVITGVYFSSVDWGDYDNDGDLDILLTGSDSSDRYSSVYENTGSGFTENVAASSVLVDVSGGSVAWGDYDNDGDLDILLTGYDGSIRRSYVYENTGSGFTEDAAASSVLIGVSESSAAWGDYDNDGDLDILLTGYAGPFNYISRVYENIGSGFTEDLTTSSVLPGVIESSAAWGDYDNDGDLDILLTGWGAGFIPLSSVYENTGSGFAEDVAASSVLTNVYNSSVAWGDYDNDGDLDILLTGRDGSSNFLSSVYENTGSGFIEDVAASSVITGVQFGSTAWGDYDNDGDLDILLTGDDDISYISSVYRNDAAATNIPPGIPNGLKSSKEGQQISLNWDPPTPLTYTTPYTSLTYNLRVGTAPGLSDILAPMSCVGICGISPDGYRQIPAMGAANHGLSATLNLPPGTYYWSVQAVDHTFTGSPWSAEGFFPGQELSISLDGNGTGSVSSDPAGISCGVDCSESYLDGTVVTLIATANKGSLFAGWGGACSGDGDCQVTMNDTKSITATFELVPLEPEFEISLPLAYR